MCRPHRIALICGICLICIGCGTSVQRRSAENVAFPLTKDKRFAELSLLLEKEKKAKNIDRLDRDKSTALYFEIMNGFPLIDEFKIGMRLDELPSDWIDQHRVTGEPAKLKSHKNVRSGVVVYSEWYKNRLLTATPKEGTYKLDHLNHTMKLRDQFFSTK